MTSSGSPERANTSSVRLETYGAIRAREASSSAISPLLALLPPPRKLPVTIPGQGECLKAKSTAPLDAGVNCKVGSIKERPQAALVELLAAQIEARLAA